VVAAALADVLAISGLKLVQVPNVSSAAAIGVSVAVGIVAVVNTRRLRAEGKLLVPAGDVAT
jgi:hypothetical protein